MPLWFGASIHGDPGSRPSALKIRAVSSRSFGTFCKARAHRLPGGALRDLLIAGALFLKAFVRVQNYDFGFNPDNVFVISMNPGLYNYSPAQTAQFYKELLDCTSNMTGVKSASVSAISTFLGLYSQDISIDGYTTPGGDNVIETLTNRTSPMYSDTLQIPFLQGRKFTDNDNASFPKVAIVNEIFARRFIVGKGDLSGALGHIFRRRDNAPIQIVGIVKDSVYGTITPLGAPAVPVFYTPFLQGTDSYAVLNVRTEGQILGTEQFLQQIIHNLDPAIAPIYIFRLMVVTERALFMPRVTAVLSGIFALIAITLAIIGLYAWSLIPWNAVLRKLESRMALGAQRSNVLRMILASSISLVLLGLIAGIIGALALSRYVSGLLIGVSLTIRSFL